MYRYEIRFYIQDMPPEKLYLLVSIQAKNKVDAINKLLKLTISYGDTLSEILTIERFYKNGTKT